jgi:CheY-like chemotaxis protein
VLIVEDNQDGADMAAVLLRQYGHSPRIARDGESALALASERMPDVVLLDYILPKMGGLDVARLLRADCGGVRKAPFIIGITGCSDAADERRAREAGVDMHLLKPANPAVIERVLDRLRGIMGE